MEGGGMIEDKEGKGLVEQRKNEINQIE